MQFSTDNFKIRQHLFRNRRTTGAIAGPSQPSSSDDDFFEEDKPIKHYEPKDFEDVSFSSVDFDVYDDIEDEDKVIRKQVTQNNQSMNFFHTNFNIPPINNSPVNIPLSISSPLDFTFSNEIVNVSTPRLEKKPINSSYFRKDNANIRTFFVSSQVPKVVLKYLERLQIFTSLREEMNEWSLIWALKQKGIPENIIFNIKSEPNHKVLSILSGICEDNLFTLRIYRKLDDDDAIKYRRRTKIIEVRCNGKRKIYLGVDPNISRSIIDLYYYDGHYFLKENTPFSLRYLESFDESFLNDKKKVNSLELILKLEEKGLIQ